MAHPDDAQPDERRFDIMVKKQLNQSNKTNTITKATPWTQELSLDPSAF